MRDAPVPDIAPLPARRSLKRFETARERLQATLGTVFFRLALIDIPSNARASHDDSR
jgi:hypothetical protein